MVQRRECKSGIYIHHFKETHALFISEHGSIIGKSKFADLRPKHVLLSCQLPHNVCMCKYHENFILAVNSLHKVVPACPAYSSSYLDEIVCQSAKEDCWVMKCADCKDRLYNRMQENVFNQEASTLSCSWHVWKEEGRFTRVQEEGSAADLAEYIISLLPYFLEHCFVKREQAKFYNEERLMATSSSFKPNVAVVQVDFSENFTCSAQDEVQSFHWVQPQISLFTVAAWYSGEHHPMIIVSDNLDHTKHTVVAYMDRLLEEIPTEINEVSVWSDGPSSQFKNRYIAASLKVLQEKHKLQVMRWNYFATSHGKGPVDGTGGAVKRQVRTHVLSRKSQVFNAENFVEVARKVSSVKIIEMSSVDIEERNQKMKVDKVFEIAPIISGITKIHAMYLKNELETYFLSKHSNMSNNLEVPVLQKIDCTQDVRNGKCVKVELQGKHNISHYAAICQSSIDAEGEVKVAFLKKVGENKSRICD